jgi:ABC-type branched-subunit amino acid transport system substrate-binding protein
MIKKITFFSCLVLLFANVATAQVDFKQYYFNGKSFFREGKYNLAMESFKKAIPYDQRNPFAEYASFYYAISAYNQGYRAVAKETLTQLKTLYPKWDKMDDVNFWLAKIHFENKDYFQGLKIASAIQDKKLQQELTLLKQQSIANIQDAETLRMMMEEYPKDEVIGKTLAKALSKNIAIAEDKALLESLINKFNLKKTDYIPEAPTTYFKEVYSVSLLFPFMLQTLEPTAAKKKNQLVLDLYEGMKLAADTLAKQNVNISLRAYDTERSTNKIQKILTTDELKNTDVIIGPLFPEENKIVQDFSAANRINVINPVSNNSEIISSNPYGFLFQPSFETLGRKSAEYLASTDRKKTCMVFYGTSKRDSVLAANFIQKATELNLKVLSSQKIAKEAAGKILTYLATPTEYDEFHYPKEFTIKKDSIGSIFVASDDALIYSKVVSSVETRADGIVVIGSESWLEQAGNEIYQRLKIVFTSPNYTQATSRNYKAFAHSFIKHYGRPPSNFAEIGYEAMLFLGQQLKKNGVYFQDGLSKEQFVPGFLFSGFNFQSSRDNQLVPFIKFDEGELVLVEKR